MKNYLKKIGINSKIALKNLNQIDFDKFDPDKKRASLLLNVKKNKSTSKPKNSKTKTQKQKTTDKENKKTD